MDNILILLQLVSLIALVFIAFMIVKRRRNSEAKTDEIITTQYPYANTREMREEFICINSFFMNVLCEKKSKSNFKRLQREYLELGTRLFYLASQKTISKFLEFKSISSLVGGSVEEHKIALLWFAEFNMLLRKDLGLKTEPEFIKDYLNIILAYWGEDEIDKQKIDDLNEQLTATIDSYMNDPNWGTCCCINKGEP